MAGQHALDLAELDPESPDLHLIIRAADEHQLPARAPAGQVAGPVHPLARLTVGACHEPLRGQPGPVQVPAGQPRPGDVHLSGHPDRHRPQPAVQHQHPEPVDGTADQAALTGDGKAAIEPRGRHVHGRLGDAIHVDDLGDAAAIAVPSAQARRVQRLAAENDQPQREVRDPHAPFGHLAHQ